MYLPIKCECVALIFFLFCGFLFTEIRKENLCKKSGKFMQKSGKFMQNTLESCYK